MMVETFTKIVVTSEGEEVVPMTQAEIDQWNADKTVGDAARSANAITEQTFLTDRANGLAKLEAAGLLPAEAKAVARKNR